MGAIADNDEGKKAQEAPVDATADTPIDQEPEKPADAPAKDSSGIPIKVTIVCSGGTVNIRRGNGTSFPRITAVKDGTVFGYIATAANGWHAVLLDSEIGWVSGKVFQTQFIIIAPSSMLPPHFVFPEWGVFFLALWMCGFR